MENCYFSELLTCQVYFRLPKAFRENFDNDDDDDEEEEEGDEEEEEEEDEEEEDDSEKWRPDSLARQRSPYPTEHPP